MHVLLIPSSLAMLQIDSNSMMPLKEDVIAISKVNANKHRLYKFSLPIVN
jgi:hypothetical protein